MLRRNTTWAVALAGLVLAQPARAADDKIEQATLAHIKLAGTLEEKPVPLDPLFGGTSENFRDKIERIRKAAKDPSIQGLYLQIESVGMGWAKLDEMSRAIADFRMKHGKKVYAYLDSGDSKDFLLALACDQVCVPESGSIMLTGVRAEVTFYKDLFDKIGVKADMLQMGDFKAAAEPFMRSSMSEPARKQLTSVIDDYYENSIIERIVKARPGRKFTADQVKKLIDQGPYTARGAHKAGLIDRVAYAEEFQESIQRGLHANRLKIAKNYKQRKAEDIDFGNPFAVLKMLMNPAKPKSSGKPKIAVIYAVGVISMGKGGESLLGGEVVGSTSMIEAIRKAENDETVKAVVLRVDSPGGSALASDLIWHELIRCNKKKPVVASMSDVAASGGYYISMAARKIYAEPGTLTGSIGVVGGKLAIGGTLDKIGIKSEVISRGANANIMSADQPFNKSERETMTALMKDVYDQFLDKALLGRQKAGKEKMTREDLVKLAGGRIWTGRQAKANGLVDELGSMEDAITAAKKLAGVDPDKELELLILPESKSFLDALIEGKSESRAPGRQVLTPALLRELPELARKLRCLDGLLQLRGEPVWLTMPYQIDVR
jgi:protease-4